MKEESIAITLPRSLVEKINEKIKRSNYPSVSDYVEDVINEVLIAEEMEVDLSSERKRAETMTNERKPQAMADVGFRGMVWCYKLVDLFEKPEKHLKKIPLKEGMMVVDYGCGPGRYTLPIAKLIGEKGKVFAVDIQPLAISMVKEKAAKENK